MAKKFRETRRLKLLGMITEGGRSRNDGMALAAKLLHVSEHTVFAWLKPETSKSSAEIPLMAIELLEIKLAKLKQEA